MNTSSNDPSAIGRDLQIRTWIFDDTVSSIPVDRIIRSNKLPLNRTVVALAGVQSNQSPRAADLASRFRGGLQVLVGGFHLSGIPAMFPPYQAKKIFRPSRILRTSDGNSG